MVPVCKNSKDRGNRRKHSKKKCAFKVCTQATKPSQRTKGSKMTQGTKSTKGTGKMNGAVMIQHTKQSKPNRNHRHFTLRSKKCSTKAGTKTGVFNSKTGRCDKPDLSDFCPEEFPVCILIN